jgi:hypothetical protein
LSEPRTYESDTSGENREREKKPIRIIDTNKKTKRNKKGYRETDVLADESGGRSQLCDLLG